jgi:heme-degrading monooxygenase HmoA
VIRRIWRAWATTEKASAYEALLRDEVFVNIKKRGIEGFRNVHLLRRDHADDVEFVILMTFDSIDAVKALVGENYEVAFVPDKARALLSHFDERAQHYEVRIIVEQ